LPRWAHRPGRTAEADQAPLDVAKRFLPPRFEGAVPADDAVFRYGLALHDRSFFWEAHEVWEAVWKAAPMNGRDRLALRALIQIANAGLKRDLGRRRAVERLVGEALALLQDLATRRPPPGAGVADGFDAAELRVALAAALLEPAGEGPLVMLAPRFDGDR